MKTLFWKIFLRMRHAQINISKIIKKKPHTISAKLFRPWLFSTERTNLVLGAVVGMFWAFVPMPFQMFPAAICCYLFRANLPLALILVWISNPLTYAPILTGQYLIGRYLHTNFELISMFFNTSTASEPAVIASQFAIGVSFSLVLAVLIGALLGLLLFQAKSKLGNIRKKRYAKKTSPLS